MKIPAVPPVRPASLVRPNEGVEAWSASDIDVDIGTGLSPAETNSINGMTLETSRRLTTAVANLADYLSSDPEFSAIVNAQDDADALNSPATPATVVVAAGKAASVGLRVAARLEDTEDTGAEAIAPVDARPVAMVATAPGTSVKAPAVIGPAAAGVDQTDGTDRAGRLPEFAPSAAVPTSDAIGSDGIPDAVAGFTEPAETANAVPDVERFENRIENLPLALERGDVQENDKSREGEPGSSNGGDGDRQKEHGATAAEIDGAALPQRQPGSVQLVPFNRRLETNGVDQTALLEAEFLKSTHAYGGHDPINWIVPLTIGSPRMSTDGGASPLPIFSPNAEDQTGSEEPSSQLIPTRLANPLVVLPPPVAVQATRLRRRRYVRLVTLYRRLRSVRPHGDRALSVTHSFLSDPRCIGVVECAVCWVDADSNRRGHRRYKALPRLSESTAAMQTIESPCSS